MSNVTLRDYKHYIKCLAKYRRLLSTRTINFKNDRQQHDIIGPPDPVSNLRPIVFARPAKETYLEKKYREHREDTQRWNQEFWFKHNTNFTKERKEFQESLKAQGKVEVTADDMSVFYKRFLDKNWQSHFNYNISWYKRNLMILLFGIAVSISKFKLK